MTWRNNYRQASFRGATFKVAASDASYGRRQVVHEHPQLDVPYTEDIGRRGDEIFIEGYCVGASYQTERDAIIKACRDESGPGKLVHPYLGEMTVVCRGLTVRESSEDGGMCLLAMVFIEAGEKKYPTTVIDSFSTISSRAASLKLASMRSFMARYSVIGRPGFVLDAVKDQISGLANQMGLPGFGELQTTLVEASLFAKSLDSFVDQAAELAANPAMLADTLISLVSDIRGAFKDPAKPLRAVYDQNSGQYAGTTATPSRRQQAENTNAFNELVRQTAIAEAAIHAATIEQPSYQDAITARGEVTDRIDTETEITASDDVYVELMAMRAAVVQALPGPDTALPRLIAYTPRATVPSLVLAYQLYGDAGREAEIVARNASIKNPAFVRGGVALEVLSDG